MFCQYCGSKNVDDASFCSNCGKSIKKQEQTKEVTPPSTTPTSPKNSKEPSIIVQVPTASSTPQTIILKQQKGCFSSCCLPLFLLLIIISIGIPVLAFGFKVGFAALIVHSLTEAIKKGDFTPIKEIFEGNKKSPSLDKAPLCPKCNKGRLSIKCKYCDGNGYEECAKLHMTRIQNRKSFPIYCRNGYIYDSKGNRLNRHKLCNGTGKYKCKKCDGARKICSHCKK